MSGHHKFSQLTQYASPERKARVAQKTALLKAQMALHELRQARQLSQVQLAELLDVRQPAVARMEKRSDMVVSHLRAVIEAMGGELEIIARFPEGVVKINNFSLVNDPPFDAASESN
jgi:transcriptional regulator with XRE-family HTH domain